MREAREIMADLAAAGLSSDQLALVMELTTAVAAEARPTEDKAANRRRAKDRAYQAQRRQNRQISADAPLNEDTSKPKEVTTGASAPSVTIAQRRAQIFVCPEGVDPTHWRDFMANRTRKHCAVTVTAYQGILSDIAEHSDAEWPPGRLVQHAAAKGWASINRPDQDYRNGQQRTAQNLRGSRPSPALDMLKRAAAEEAAERGDEADYRGAWPSLPAIGTG